MSVKANAIIHFGGIFIEKVLFVTSEAVPFIKTGGLADVAGSLPQYFDKTKYDVRIILPKYVCMEEDRKVQLRFHSRFYVRLSWRSQLCRRT